MRANRLLNLDVAQSLPWNPLEDMDALLRYGRTIIIMQREKVRRNFFSFHSRRTRGVKSSGRAGKTRLTAWILRYRVRISRGHLSLIRFPFVFQLQDCLKSYGPEEEHSYKKQKPHFVVKSSSAPPTALRRSWAIVRTQ